MKRALAIASLALLPLVAASDVAPRTSSFLGAPGGVDEAFLPLALPPLRASFSSRLVGTTMLPASAFEPSLQELLAGETVITSAAQMKAVWARLFDTPYDPTLFDFGTDFVVLMGGGVLPPGATFDVSSVESVAGNYSNAGGLGGPTEDDPFLCVTATTFLPGVLPAEPPPDGYLVSAVRVSRTLLDDVGLPPHDDPRRVIGGAAPATAAIAFPSATRAARGSPVAICRARQRDGQCVHDEPCKVGHLRQRDPLRSLPHRRRRRVLQRWASRRSLRRADARGAAAAAL